MDKMTKGAMWISFWCLVWCAWMLLLDVMMVMMMMDVLLLLGINICDGAVGRFDGV